MTPEEQILWCAHDAYVAEQSTTRIPTGVARLAGIGHHLYKIVLTIFQFVGNIQLEAHVAIVRATHTLHIHQHTLDRLDQIGAQSDIRDKVIVHEIKVNIFNAELIKRLYLRLQIQRVGAHQRR